MNRSPLRLIPLLAGLVVFACGEAPSTTPTPGAGDEVTWYKDVAPLVNTSCVECHQSGGVAPFSLDTYTTARQWGAAMEQSVRERRMPPWYATGDGSCGDFSNNHWLSDAEIAVFTRWMEAGYPEGDPADAPPPWEPDDGLGPDALSYTMAEAYVPVIAGSPDAPKDDYRCFILSEGRDADGFVTAFEALPGNPAVVHHIHSFSVDPDQEVGEVDGVPFTNRDRILALDAEEEGRPGWACYGVAGDGVVVNGLVGSWAPGAGTITLPEGTGVSLRAQDWIVIQVHYNLDNGAGSDQSTLKYHLEPSVARQGYIVLPDGLLATLYDGDPFVIEPGQGDVAFTWTASTQDLSDYLATYYAHLFETLPTAYDVHGVFPHMHALGKRFKATYTDGGGGGCLIDMPTWDFNWQHLYLYREAIHLSGDETVEVTCNYDSRARITPTFPGESSTDEMCLLGVYFTVAL